MNEIKPEQINQLTDAIFFPRADMPFGAEASGARDHMFDLQDSEHLRLRLFPGDPVAPMILFFHGNGETARDYDALADQYRSLPSSLAIAEYRGYGPSTGRPSFTTFLKDAHATLDEVKKIMAKEGFSGPVIIMGRSLGSAPAIELAATRADDVAGLIVESGFARTVPLLELIGIPARMLGITEEHGPRNLDKMDEVSLPTLIIHAEQDEIIPIADGELLYEACKDPKKVIVRVPRAGHNDIQMRAGESYFSAIGDLLKRTL